MRVLGGIAVLATIVAAVTLGLTPEAAAVVLSGRREAVSIAVAFAAIGAGLMAFLAFALAGWRFGRLATAAERLSGGQMDVRVTTTGGGVDGRLARSMNAIAGSLEASQNAASTDRLTGVANRAILLERLFAEVERAGRYDRPLSVAFVDIDHFKQVNDTYGHAFGDVVLRGVAQTIAASLRTSDLIGRYGGEEFMLVLTETTVEDASILAEKLRQLVSRQPFAPPGHQPIAVTVSIGVAGGHGQVLRLDSLVRDADAAMYSAKSLGRNQTYIFAEPSDDARVPSAPISPYGRDRAMEVGRLAREAAQKALTSVVADLPSHRGRPSDLIAAIAVGMGRGLDLPDAEIERLSMAALLHDIGKVAVPDDVLDKPGPLNASEWRSMVQHPRIGQLIIEQSTAIRDTVPIILHHHERYAGNGYPFGLHGNAIPLGARIVAIADAYDAMTRERPYRPAVSHADAVREIQRNAGSQFDPMLVALFCDLYGDAPPTAEPAIAALLAARAEPPDLSRQRTRRRRPMGRATG
jgi:diguanylate cyclase (GGDEF)-like protein